MTQQEFERLESGNVVYDRANVPHVIVVSSSGTRAFPLSVGSLVTREFWETQTSQQQRIDRESQRD